MLFVVRVSPIDDLNRLRECRDCGLIQELPPIADGEAVVCIRCGSFLQRAARDLIPFARLSAVLASLLFLVALALPLVDLSVLGRVAHSGVATGAEKLADFDSPVLRDVVVATLIVFPALKLTLELVVLFGATARRVPSWLARLFVWLERTSPWAMVEVFLLGCFVAYTRLKALAHVDVGLAALALGGVTLCMTATDATLDREAIWQRLEAKRTPERSCKDDQAGAPSREILGCGECGRVMRGVEGEPCVRCREPLERRRGDLARVWALLVAAALLYVPANILPVMTYKRSGHGGPTTIFHGVVELTQSHLWPLAILVLSASIIVPVLKLVSLVAMLVLTHQRSPAWLRGRTRLFRFVKFIGRWSMIDIFMLAVLVGVVRFGAIATVLPGPGAVAFCAVVLLTMWATEIFDPRLMWDAAADPADDPEARDQLQMMRAT